MILCGSRLKSSTRHTVRRIFLLVCSIRRMGILKYSPSLSLCFSYNVLPSARSDMAEERISIFIQSVSVVLFWQYANPQFSLYLLQDDFLFSEGPFYARSEIRAVLPLIINPPTRHPPS
ncbi:hypothetical protein HRM2_03830 [Desulforapulum autotrophicum HRM2]|uniref:Uncharacterized protein n=1 Tax=Desulforapulum autotrophicum (strain ATCC 43914 / DSM 3382 / VKM B-1955 / HRM2) TaxID=177437 RepID=C0QGM7_DESAH|nr:hypothetical protein HRM2_03830 [Desulforapulum autotrophicum HRM2]